MRAVVLPAALATACGGGDDPTEPGKPDADPGRSVARVEFTVTHDTIETEEHRRLGVRVIDDRGDQVVGRQLEWSSSHPQVADLLDNTGAVAGYRPGTTRVEAAVDGRRGSMELTVLQAQIARIALDGVPPRTRQGDVVWLNPTAWSTRDNPLRSVRFTFESSDTTLATISADGYAFLRGRGAVSLTARSGDQAVTVTTEIGPPRVTRLSVALPSPWLVVGGSDSIHVTTYGRDGAVLTEREVTYTSSDTTVLTVDSLGVMRARARGRSSVLVRSDGAATSFPIVVLPEQPVELVVAPARRAIAPDQMARIGARFRGASGAILEDAPPYAAYRSSDPEVATLWLDGTRARSLRPGRTDIRVKVGDLIGTATFVVEEPSAGGIAIDIVPVGYVPPSVLEGARAAARRWARVVKGGPMPQPLTLPDSACGARTPALDRTVDGIAIFLQAEKIDGPGGTLAMAGPCVLRGYDERFPVVGVMSVDADDVALAAQYGLMEDLLMHEIGHVLGIGTLWNLPDVREFVPEGAEPRFVGASARDAARRFGFLDAGERGIPVEIEGGEGTAGAHWRERDFGPELMTGWLEPRTNVLGAFTVGALADLGYDVDEVDVGDFIGLPTLPAVPWEQPAQAPSVQAPLARRERHPAHRLRMADRLVRPHLQVDPQGRATPIEGRTRR